MTRLQPTSLETGRGPWTPWPCLPVTSVLPPPTPPPSPTACRIHAFAWHAVLEHLPYWHVGGFLPACMDSLAWLGERHERACCPPAAASPPPLPYLPRAAGMEHEEALGKQAFEVLAQRKRASRRERRAAAAAATSEEEEGEGEEEERLPAAGQHEPDGAPMQADEAGPSSAAGAGAQKKGRRGRRGRQGGSAFGARWAGATRAAAPVHMACCCRWFMPGAPARHTASCHAPHDSGIHQMRAMQCGRDLG